MIGRTRKLVRAGLIYLTVSFVVVGLWATLDPRGFYHGFPGGGRVWVAGAGPYNPHLMTDTGVGFLAVGVVLLLAAIWMDIRLIQAALVATVVHDGPHLMYHLHHPTEALLSIDALLSNGAIASGVLLALALLVAVTRGQKAIPAGLSAGMDRPGSPERQLSTTSKVRTS